MNVSEAMDYDEFAHVLREDGAPDGPRQAVTGVLEEIASGERELRAVEHPLGFLCLPLVRDGARGVCVHLFEQGTGAASPADTQMHAHSWELMSHVLYGRVSNVPVRVEDATSEPTHRVFEVHSDPAGVDELRPTARLVECLPGPEETSGTGETYTLPPGEFHSTVVARDEPAATLVLGRSLPGHTDLVLGPVHGGGHRTVRRLCGATHTERTVRTALRRVHGEPAG
ncbi:hypothetical protein H181DRAFT_03928 [Streptomyces sp. WMMB 714]|uniref:hypothetical protein n=1 Tax=Streptomyces sp. WMMB 714 TaxID=1286822 RepID=UPI000823A669|nr:hypothetical protein [Streptomyces sp. WMMB 714]SCK44462.1 hypothetical protein H181DRAFT_03928 [Streptomyces sp. WMMB 714]